jgi:uncharacterized protein
MTAASLADIYRYPVKGFTPHAMDWAELRIGETLRNDRAYAIENGPSGFDPAAPQWFPKTKFLCWMAIPKVAQLHSRFEDDGAVFTVRHPAHGQVSASLGNPEGRHEIGAWLSAFLGEAQRGPLRVLQAEGHSFSDVPMRVVSLINLASAEALAAEIGAPVDPIRFRGNLHLAGLDPWVEATWLGRTVAIGETVLRIVKTTQRCLATHVDPARGERDLDIMGTIRRMRGDLDCGVYGEVVQGGTIRPGDTVKVISEAAAA